jgi:protein associated with RNAse G/E
VYLGHDEWGDWFGQLPGWSSARPGFVYDVKYPSVTLMPPSGDFAYTHNAPPHGTRVYIDIAWDLHWQDGAAAGIDMDLDVVRTVDGRGLYIDDRDEWDEHRLQYGYPLDIVSRLETLTVQIEARVRADAAPFDDATADVWLDRLADLVRPPA